MNMIFTFSCSFKAKPDQFLYFNNDYEDNVKEKVEIIEVNQSELVFEQ